MTPHLYPRIDLVEEVSCTADAINVVMNKSDPDIQKWMTNPRAQPVVYVQEHKDRAPCGTAMKKGNLVNYNFTIPYGKHCDVILTDLVLFKYNLNETFKKSSKSSNITRNYFVSDHYDLNHSQTFLKKNSITNDKIESKIIVNSLQHKIFY